MAKKALVEYALNIRQSCRAFGISETWQRYEAIHSDENAEIADWLLRLTAWQLNWLQTYNNEQPNMAIGV